MMSQGILASFSIDSSKSSPRDFLDLLKPGVMSLVVFTGWIGMMMAPAKAHPFLNFVNLLALALASGGAAAFNMWYDRDIDMCMSRTRQRPIPLGRIAPHDALTFSVVISCASVLLMVLTGAWLAAGVLIFSHFFYSVVYTALLKRTTSHNIVIGGLAGALPPLIGWLTVSPQDVYVPLWMVCLVFIWTPSHFWALSLLRCEDYRTVGVPMLPVIHGAEATRRSIYAYSLALFVVMCIPFFWQGFGLIYGLSTVFLGGVYVYYAHQLYVKRTDLWAGRLFGYSIIYLFAYFACIYGDHVCFISLR